MARRWKGVLAIEGQMTGDGREIKPGALTWGTPPLPLAWLQQSQHGDGFGNPGGVDLGNIDQIDRADDQIVGAGQIDDASEHGAEFVRKLDEGTAPMGERWGLSVDVDDVVIEIVDTQPETGEDADEVDDDEVLLASMSGLQAVRMWRSQAWQQWAAMTAAAGDAIPDHAEVMEQFDPGRFVMRLTAGRVRGVTACPVPAFDGAFLELDGESSDTGDEDAGSATEDEGDDEAMAASGTPMPNVPLAPPRAWFTDSDAPQDDDDPRLAPQYDLNTGAFIGYAVPLTITDDGRVFGQLAPANRCHTAHSVCITVPESASAYAHFHIGTTKLDDGSDVDTGSLLVGCDHAPLDLTMAGARDHYANTGLAWADVRVFENRYGPWVTGSLRPGVTQELVRTLRGGGISGDWRGSKGTLELMAIQAVPVPGFTVQRVRPLAASASTWTPREWSPSLLVRGDDVLLTSPPIQPAPVTAAASCGCQARPTTEQLLLDVLDEVRQLRAQQRAMRAIVEPMRADAVAKLALRIRGS